MTQLVRLNRRPSGEAKPAKVLLVSPCYGSSSYFPIGLAYVSSYIRSHGHEVVALNLTHHGVDEGYAALEAALRDPTIDVVGITGLTVAFVEIERMVQFIRARSSCPVVLGGGITSCESELVMETIRPDYMVVSEGELIFKELLDVIARKGDPAAVRGIWYWDGATPRSTGEGPSIANLDDLPHPDLDLFGMQRELELQSTRQISYHETRFDAGKMIPITASRSCPFRCTFCYHAGMGKYRRHSMVNVVDHIEQVLARFPEATHVMIYDELFSANKKRIVEFCELLDQRGIKISWYCQLRVDQLDQELLHRMRASGCRHISFGFESGSDTVLESMDKKIVASQIARAVALTRAAKIGIQANFLFGDPAETRETLAETLRFQQEHDLMFVDWSAVIPYPGTRLFKHALEHGKIGDRVEFIRSLCNLSGYLWKDMINLTQLPDEVYRELYVELRELNDRNHRSRPAVVKASAVVDAVTSQLVLACPSCAHESAIELPYPPPATDGKVELRSAIGVQGYNVVCDACNRKMHLMPKQIPHVGRIYAAFQAELDRMKERGDEVVLLPAMDRFWGVFAEDVALAGLNVVGVLDSRPNRIGQPFLGHTVETLEPTNLARFAHAKFVVLPWVEYDRALAALDAAGIDRGAVVCWNEMFGVAMGQLPAHAAANDGAQPRAPATFAAVASGQ